MTPENEQRITNVEARIERINQRLVAMEGRCAVYGPVLDRPYELTVAETSQLLQLLQLKEKEERGGEDPDQDSPIIK